MPEVTVVVPVRDGATTLGAALDALAVQRDAPPYEVIVVDDGSGDGSAELAERHPLLPRVLRLDGAGRRGGAGPARDAGIKAAAGAILAFTDADCRPAPGWLAAGVAAIGAGADLVQGRVVPDPEAPRTRYDRTLAVERETGLYEMASLFARRESVERAGGSRPGFELGGRPFGEDTLLGWRIRRTGGRTAYCREAVVHHAVFPGGPRELLAERRRLALFPALAREVPELRAHAFHRRLFLSKRTAAFDLAAAGAAAALAARHPLPLLAALPYARRVRRETRGAPHHAAVSLAADLTGFLALVRGSVKARTPVL